MAFVAIALSICFVYWLLYSFVVELTRPEVPKSVVRQMELKRRDDFRSAA